MQFVSNSLVSNSLNCSLLSCQHEVLQRDCHWLELMAGSES